MSAFRKTSVLELVATERQACHSKADQWRGPSQAQAGRHCFLFLERAKVVGTSVPKDTWQAI